MPPDDDPLPGAIEIKLQLDRILSGSEFATRPKSAEVFRFLVESALQGQDLTEEDIRSSCFPSPPYDPDASHTRTAMHAVRTLLAEYYESHGSNDEIVIELPKKFSRTAPRKVKGKSYPVVSTYNPAREENMHIKLARSLMARGTSKSVMQALGKFETILKTRPNHLAANVGKLECLLIQILGMPSPRSRKEVAEEAIALAARLINENPADWNPYLLNAVLLLGFGRWDEALFFLGSAMKLNLEATTKSLWCPVASLLFGMPKSACNYACVIAKRRGSDFVAWTVYAFCLYFNRDFEPAAVIFKIVLQYDERIWAANIGLALVCLSWNNPEAALAFYRNAQEQIGEEKPFQPGLGILMTVRPTCVLEGFDKLQDWPPGYAKEFLRHLSLPSPEKDWIQMALMFRDDLPEFAKLCLKMAIHYGSALALLPVSWPVFDPLDPVQLLKEFKLPRLLDQAGPDPSI
jgi:tetratricopeptide (TPR) repeat protein